VALFIALVKPSVLLASDFSGDISFLNCKQNCNANGEPELKFHNKADYILRLVVDKNTYFPLMKVINATGSAINWSFHIVFFDHADNIIATYALSGETKPTGKYAQSNSSSRITMNLSDMKKIIKYKAVIYTL
jgi:hypothetical protein